MIKLSVHTKPFSVENESGDFYQYLEFDDYFLLVVGDIGGHGSSKIYSIACEIKNVIEKNKDNPLSNIISLIHKQEILHHHGMTIFVAQIYKNMPMIHYSAVGNIKATIVRKNNFLPLRIQEGIVGYDIPTSIKTHMTKISNGDILLVNTDGVSLHKEQFMHKFGNIKIKDIDSITKHCVEYFGNDDDRLCLALYFEIEKSKYFSIQHTELNNNSNNTGNNNDTRKEKQNNYYHASLFANDAIDFDFHAHANINKTSKLTLLTKERLLIQHLEHTSVKRVISKISTIAQIEKMLDAKIKIFLHEMTKYSDVDIYLSKFLLQLHIYDIKHHIDSLEFLFNNYFITQNNECIINIDLQNLINFNDERFNALKEAFALGLDDAEYIKFKENEKHIQKMAGQARLSAMGEMIGNIAHQWRQPLSVISTSASSLSIQKEFGILTDEIFYKACETINNSAQYLSTTIDDFRDFIKGDTKEEAFELKTFIDKAFSILQASIKDNHINLIINPYENIKMFGALNLLIQTIVNIVSNAKDILVERNIKTKLVFLAISHTKDDVIIKITDNGGGVPNEIKDKIFDAYFTTKHQSKGTGLGLNMAFNIIMNSFQGTLEVENTIYTYEGLELKGARFILTLPLKKA